MATVQSCIDQAKWQLDRSLGGRIVASAILPVANRLYKQAYDKILAKHGNQFALISSNFTLTGGTETLSAQLISAIGGGIANFYRLYGNDQHGAVQRLSKDLVTWRDVAPYRRDSLALGWYLQGTAPTLYFSPITAQIVAGTYRIHYLPTAPDYILTDTIVDFNGWIEDFLVKAMALLARDREEEDPQLLAGLLNELDERIADAVPQVGGGGTRRTIDVRRTRRDDWDV